ncbi:hypothetical protein ABEF95_014495 [Exophiala dermatitidis]
MTSHEEAMDGAVRHRKRILTPARKEQNRIAQRLYRQRQKTRRQGQHSSSLTEPLDLRPRPGPEARQCHPRQLKEHDLPKEAEIQPSPLRPLTAESSPTLGDFSSLELNANPTDLEFMSYQLPLELVKGQPSPIAGLQETHQPTLLSESGHALDASIPFNIQSDAQNIHITDYEHNFTTSDIFGLQLKNTIWAPGPSSHTYMSEASTIAYSTSSPSSLDISSRLLVSPVDYSGSVETDGTIRSSSPRPLAGSSRFHGLAQDNLNHPLPDLWCNNIQFNSSTIFNAFLTIAVRLGFNLRDLVDAKNCLSTATNSPFYRPTSPQDDPQALLAAAQLPFAPSNLQPTLPQILIPHHPFLDLIPFPAIRASAITLAAAMPNAFSMTELKKDVYIHGALVCWVGGRGIGSGQPWDPRSWEAAPWFLHKWRLLLGGETGEMWKTSTWWRESRREG